jgi:nucleoside-diphosphate-sugar epimerase
MKTLLITGANGALGKVLSTHLKSNKSYRVITAGRQQGCTDYVFDIFDDIKLKNCLVKTQPQIIFHLVASYSKDFEESYKTNVEATKKLLDLVKAELSSARVVLIGSAAEYGIVENDDNPIKEIFRLKPVTTYGLTKSLQTMLMHFYQAQNVDVVLARIFNLYGDGISPHLLAGNLLNQLKDYKNNGITKIVTGDLSQIRDFISVEEASKQLECIALKGESGEIYHVATGVPMKAREFALKILKMKGVGEEILLEEKQPYLASSVEMIYADMSKTENLLCNNRIRS